MTRKELIEQKAKELGQKYFPNENNIWARPNYEAQYVECACKEMVEWADEHPNLYSVTRKAVERERKYLIDKVCKWLEEHLLLDDPKWYVEGEKTLQEKVIDDLRKAMEE